MTRVLGITALVLSVLTVGSFSLAQSSRAVMPMGGAVIDSQGRPLVGAQVVLVRHATLATGARHYQTVAQAQTDNRGAFSFGSVALDTSVSFPLETGMSLDFAVVQDKKEQRIADISYTAPRDASMSVASVSAEIRIQ
jgi:hypothetical protein